MVQQPHGTVAASPGSTASRRCISPAPYCIFSHQAQALAESWQMGLLWSSACCRGKLALLQLPPAWGTPAKNQWGDQLLFLHMKRLLLDNVLWGSLVRKQSGHDAPGPVLSHFSSGIPAGPKWSPHTPGC